MDAMTTTAQRAGPDGTRGVLVLASQSPRRRAMLGERGIAFVVREPGLDDAELTPGRWVNAGAGPAQRGGTLARAGAWAAALAYLKARATRARLAQHACDDGPEAELAHAAVLGADTVVVRDGALVGKPGDGAEAAMMIRAMRNRRHAVVTGAAWLDGADGGAPAAAAAFSDRAPASLLADVAFVSVGHVTDEAIEAYVASGAWAGKAGGYNLAERVAAGWPIEVEGDPATVMGLPLRRLEPWLAGWASRVGTGGAGTGMGLVGREGA